MKNKKIIIKVMYIIIALCIFLPNTSKAVLQSNGGTSATKNVNTWLLEIRQMQQAGGALGLTDTINGTNLTSGNKNLDIHMEKNTEYGAMALLSASAYGNQNKIVNGGTTTGNSTGIVMKLNNEWVSAGLKNMNIARFTNASGRYKNIYTAETTGGKVGDAIQTVANWHSEVASIGHPNGNNWLLTTQSALLRGLNSDRMSGKEGSIFTYYGFSGYNYSGLNTHAWASRAVVVCGSGV